jgi:hypothetical protein
LPLNLPREKEKRRRIPALQVETDGYMVITEIRAGTRAGNRCRSWFRQSCCLTAEAALLSNQRMTLMRWLVVVCLLATLLFLFVVHNSSLGISTAVLAVLFLLMDKAKARRQARK